MRILIVDDNPADRTLARREVKRERPDADVTEVDSQAAFREALRQPFDVAVLDYSLGWTNGLEALKAVRRANPDIGAVLFTGSLGEELAVEALKSGFDDYVIKDASRLRRLRGAVAALAARAQERREARLMRERHEQLFQSVPVGLFTCAQDGRFRIGNPALLAMLGAESTEALQERNLFELFEWDGPRDWTSLQAAGAAGVEAALTGVGDAPRTVLLQAHQVPGQDAYQGAVTDVTPLRRAVHQKELLLLEVLHRVYNNLQSVQALLRLQAKRFDDPRVREAFEDVSARVSAMAMVQQKLHTGGDHERLNFADFLIDLVSARRDAADARQVRIELDAEPVYMHIERALPLGLVASELLTNAVEHAFPEGRTGRVAITLERSGDGVLLTVEDNGIGLQADGPSGGLGSILVERLVRQLGGEVSFDGDGEGLRAQVRAAI